MAVEKAEASNFVQPEGINPNEEGFDLQAYLDCVDGDAIRFKEYVIKKVKDAGNYSDKT
jgi:hypothetical protein